MKNDKLEEIGQKLDLSPSDVRKIGEERRKRKIYTTIVGGITAFVSFLAGLAIGLNSEPRMEYRGYPYGVSGMWMPCGLGCIGIPSLFIGAGYLHLISRFNKKGKYRLVIHMLKFLFLVLSVIACIAGYHAGRPVEYYAGSIEYGVYTKIEPAHEPR